MTDLGTLGGGSSAGNAVNNSGHGVGVSETSGGDTHAFYFDGETLLDLGTLGGENSNAYGINDSDEAVGSAQVEGGTYHAFYYDGDALVDLSGLLSENSAWDYLIAAYDISDLGQIVGVGVMNGVITAFLMNPSDLTPVPAPGGIILLGSCLLGVGVRRMKRSGSGEICFRWPVVGAPGCNSL
jgi:probable HAF family extracellular repeat protein